MMPAGEIVARLRDHENEGVTGSDRFHLRNEAANALEALEREVMLLRIVRDSNAERAESEFDLGLEEGARIAETFHDFGPATQCPNCGKSDHVLRCYTLGRQDAAAAIRARKSAGQERG